MAAWVIFWIVVWGALCGYIASQKGRSGFAWFMGGVAFGVFALIAVCAVPSIKE